MSCNDVSSIKEEMKHQRCLKMVLVCVTVMSLQRMLVSLFCNLIS